MKRILYVASTYGHIASFHIPYIKKLQEAGYLVDMAGSNSNIEAKANLLRELPSCTFVDMPFEKRMFSYKNLKVTLLLRKQILKGQYDIISVHTSLASFYVRLAVLFLFSQKNSRPILINTVHGYLFDYKTPFLKRTAFLLAERITKSVTNHLVVMNQEDYEIAQKYHLYTDALSIIPGMGINTDRFKKDNFTNLDRNGERSTLGINPSDIIMIYAAEFSERKNQEMLITAMSNLPQNVKLILAGQGEQIEKCKELSQKSGLSFSSSHELKNSQLAFNDGEKILFIGHVKNLEYYYFLSDICVSSSRIEGLPFNIMEAMSMGLPVIATRIKGHVDLIEEKKNGLLYDYDSVEAFCDAVLGLIKLPSTDFFQISNNNIKKASCFDLKKIYKKVLEVYAL